MKTFDCCLTGEIPVLEIEAKSEREAKKLYLEALVRALTIDCVDAVEVDLVDD